MNLEQNIAFDSGLAVHFFDHRTKIRVTDSSRVSFLQSSCTNDVKKLASGEGCEAYILNLKGKIVAHVNIFQDDDCLTLDGFGQQFEAIANQFKPYLIIEDVLLDDCSEKIQTALLSGPDSESFFSKLLNEHSSKFQSDGRSLLQSVRFNWMGGELTVRRVSIVSESDFLLEFESEKRSNIKELLSENDATIVDSGTFNARRISFGYPEYGVDFSELNLPQEIARDKNTISYEKGCYLGQETVARIWALGQVNKLISLVEISTSGESDEKTTGNHSQELTHQLLAATPVPLVVEGKEIGKLTSVCDSLSDENKSLGICTLRRKFAKNTDPFDVIANERTLTLKVLSQHIEE